MKRVVRIVLLILALALVPFAGDAETQKEWDQSCYNKIIRNATLYSVERIGWEWDETPVTVNVQPVGTIASGTYIKTSSFDSELDLWEITYFKNGSRATGWIKSDDFAGAAPRVYLSDGTSVSLPEALVADPAALEAYISKKWPGKTLKDDKAQANESIIPDGIEDLPEKAQVTEKPGTSTNTGNKKPSGEKKPAKAPKKMNTAVIMAEEKTVTLVRLGVLTSTINRDGVTEEIATGELSFGGDVRAEQAVAVIHAPQSGKCTLREGASDGAKTIQKSKAGTVVSVLEYGREYSKINDNGTVGYVKTSCLKFYGGEIESLGVGTLTYKGKATGKTTINVRSDGRKDSARITEWKTGTEVVVFALRDGWYEVEHDGVHGFVMDDFLTMRE